MSICTIVILGVFLAIAILYCALGGGILGICIVFAFAAIAALFAINDDNTPVGGKLNLLNRVKPYQCQWCRKKFWTLNGCSSHGWRFHGAKMKEMQNAAQFRHKGKSTSHHPYECSWCGGSGKINGVICDWCGGSGKLP